MIGIPTTGDIRRAAERIKPHAHRTPVLTCEGLDRLAGCRLFFKCENFQKVGAFKFRGACNAVFSLPDEEIQNGVATHSSGNHAAALALAASLRGTRAHIVMPQDSPAVKKAAVASYGAEITWCRPTLRAREDGLAEVIERTGATEIHPYDDPRIIAGQATAALELLEQIPDLDAVLAPVGGGGLSSGTCLAVKALSPRTPVIGAEPQGADDAYRSLQAGKIIPSLNPDTIADGLLTSLGELTFSVLSRHMEKIITVDDPSIISAMRHVWERMKIVIEPSSAVPVAAVLQNKDEFSEKRVGVIISGGNVELSRLPF
jgi:threonine dehydratase